jgi:hypothetical protein
MKKPMKKPLTGVNKNTQTSIRLYDKKTGEYFGILKEGKK